MLLKRFVLRFAISFDLPAPAAARSMDATPVGGATVNILRLHMSTPPPAEASPDLMSLMSLEVSTDRCLSGVNSNGFGAPPS